MPGRAWPWTWLRVCGPSASQSFQGLSVVMAKGNGAASRHSFVTESLRKNSVWLGRARPAVGATGKVREEEGTAGKISESASRGASARAGGTVIFWNLEEDPDVGRCNSRQNTKQK